MKRLATMVSAAFAAVVASAVPALAQQYPPYPPQPGGGGGNGAGPAGGGDLAFTGAEIALWMILAAVLISAGIAAVILGRRRRAVLDTE